MTSEFLAGCIGGCAGVIVGHPLDTIKVRLQTQDSLNPKYRGTWHCLTDTVRAESVRGLYKGMSSPIAGVSVVNAIIFGVHGNIMRRVQDPTAISSHAMAGAGAGFVQAFIACPMELAKTRMQIQSNSSSSMLYKGPLDCLKTIYRTEGLRGIFRGQAITIMRELPGFATYFGGYEFLVRKMGGDDPSAPAILMAGGFAGIFSWVVTYPIDVVKSRLQADGMNGTHKYKGIRHCVTQSIATEGLSVMRRGLTSTVLRAFPTNAATFSVVSWVMKMGQGEGDSLGDTAAWKDVLARGEIILSASAGPITSHMYPSFLKHHKQFQIAISSIFFPTVSALDLRPDPEDVWESPDSRLD